MNMKEVTSTSVLQGARRSFMIPYRWESVTVGDIGSYINGMAFKPEDWKDSGIPIVRIQNLTNPTAPFNYYDKPVENDVEISDGDVLISWSATLGVFKWTRGKAILNQHIFKAIPNSRIDKEFFYYAISNQIEQMKKMTHGTTMKHITKKPFLSTIVPLPSMPEQRRIAAILSKADDLIHKTNEIIEQTRRLKKGLLQRLLTKGIAHSSFKKTYLSSIKAIEIPKEWTVVRIGDICTVKRGSSPRPITNPAYFGDGRGWVRISDATNSGKYLRNTVDHLSKLGESWSVPVNNGDLIMSIAATVGRPIIVQMDACIHDGFVVFQDLQKSADTEFFYYLLLTLGERFSNLGQHGTQRNLNSDIVAETKVPLPPISEQKRIASILSMVDKQIELELLKKESFQQVKEGLMQKLLTGQIRVKV